MTRRLLLCYKHHRAGCLSWPASSARDKGFRQRPAGAENRKQRETAGFLLPVEDTPVRWLVQTRGGHLPLTTPSLLCCDKAHDLMGWYRKEQPSPFDNARFNGLFFLDGDVLAQRFQQGWTKGEKSPMLMFPSKIICEVWESSNPERDGCIVHLFGEMDLPLYSTRDQAFVQAADIAEQVGYRAHKVGDNHLELRGHDREEHVLVTYDDDLRQMVNVEPVRMERPQQIPRPMPLLTEEIRQQLPPMGSGETLGDDALAQVKFFTPDAGWTWYASEFDGEDTFFGLVIGDFIEFGSFSLTELEEIRGPLHLPLERDLYFEPTPLGELKARHAKERGEQP